MSCVLANASASARPTLPSVRLSVRLFRFQLFSVFAALLCEFPCCCCCENRTLIYGVCVWKKRKKACGCAGGGAAGSVGTRRQAKVRHSRGPSRWWRWCWWAGIVFDMLRAHMQVADILPYPPDAPHSLAHFQLRLLLVTHIHTHTHTDTEKQKGWLVPHFAFIGNAFTTTTSDAGQHEQKIVNAIRRA